MRALLGLALAAVTALASLSAQAQGLIRDAEIEETLNRLTEPLVVAAGLPKNSISVHIVNDREMNAFVTGGGDIFVNAGLIQRLGRADMLQAVLAHEIGHVTSGHVAQRSVAAAQSGRVSLAGVALGILAGAAGSPEAGIFIAQGSQRAQQRGQLAFSRSQEASADQSSIRILEAAGIDPKAAVDTLGLFRGQELLSTDRIDPYVLTHPLSSERMALLERSAAASTRAGAQVSPPIAEAYARMQAKFDGFIRPPQSALDRVSGRNDMPARIQRAIALHRLPDPAGADREIDAAIALEPNNPWLYELKGQFRLESGDARGAVGPYERALALRPDAALLRAGLGRALLALNTPEANARALQELSRAREGALGTPVSLRALAEAHARAGNQPQAALYTAERFALSGSAPDAERFARIAMEGLPRGSPEWIRAQEILSVVERARGG